VAAPWPETGRTRSNGFLIPVLAVAAILALGAGTVVALYLTGVIGNRDSGTVAATDPKPVTNGNANSTAPADNRPADPAPGTNVNTGSEVNTGPAPAPPPAAPDPSAAKADVMSAMDSWAASLRARSLDANLSMYADRLDTYYGSQNVSSASVRANRQQIFSRYYDSMDVQLSDVSVDLSPDGSRADVSYDNTYSWRGGSRTLSGKSHNRIVMERIGGRWLITSEIHISQYYENHSG
jgi:ketosteroid isomerase-like protein